MITVEFHYEGRNIPIQCNKYDKIKKIFQQFYSKADVNQNSVVFIYGGDIITNMDLTLDNLANIDDKNRNKMNILVSKSDNSSSSSQFNFLINEGADESMKEYAKMAILLAMQEYPDDDRNKSFLIASKFAEKYGGRWNCSFVKEGGCTLHYNGYYLGIKYGGYKITIARAYID